MNSKSLICIYVSILLFCHFSCVKDEDIEEMSLIPGKEIHFEIPIHVSPRTTCIKSWISPDDKTSIFYLNKSSNSLLVFSTQTQELIKEIQFERQGKNGVGNVTGISPISDKEFFVSSSGQPILYRVNSDGHILQKYDYSDTGTYTSLASKISNDFVTLGNAFVLPQQLSGTPSELANSNMAFEQPLFLSFNPATSKFSTLPIYLPKKYFDGGPVNYYLSSLADKKNLYWSFQNDHNIFYSDDLSNLHKVNAPSRYFEKFSPLKENIGLMGYWKYQINAPQYWSLLYDEKQEVFYRFVKLPAEDLSNADLDQFRDFPPSFSIIILDKNLNVLGETIFEGKEYNFFNFFIGNEGLYLSTGNPMNPEFDENVLSFQLLELKSAI